MRPDELYIELMENMSDEEKRQFLDGLKALDIANPIDREALRESIKRLRPDFTEAQIGIFVEGRARPETDDWMA